MDDRLQKATEHANYRVSLAMQRDNLRLALENSLIYAVSGGQFTVTRELIAFTAYLLERGDDSHVVFADDKNNPIMILDVDAFLKAITEVYHRAHNAFYNEYEKLKKARTVKALTGL